MDEQHERTATIIYKRKWVQEHLIFIQNDCWKLETRAKKIIIFKFKAGH